MYCFACSLDWDTKTMANESYNKLLIIRLNYQLRWYYLIIGQEDDNGIIIYVKKP